MYGASFKDELSGLLNVTQQLEAGLSFFFFFFSDTMFSKQHSASQTASAAKLECQKDISTRTTDQIPLVTESGENTFILLRLSYKYTRTQSRRRR